MRQTEAFLGMHGYTSLLISVNKAELSLSEYRKKPRARTVDLNAMISLNGFCLSIKTPMPCACDNTILRCKFVQIFWSDTRIR